MSIYYNLSPPNDIFNDECEDAALCGMRYPGPAKQHPFNQYDINTPLITNDPYFVPTEEKQYDLTDAWDGYIFTELLRQSKEVTDALENLQYKNWLLLHQKKLRIAVDKLFQSEYRKAVDARELELAVIFYDNNPGIYTGFRGSHVEKETNDAGETIEVIHVPPMSDADWLRAKRSFAKALPLVVEWCMNDFSYRRLLWRMDNPPFLDITSIEVDEELFEGTKLEIKDEVKTKPQKISDGRKAVQNIDPAVKKWKNLIAGMKRKGKFQDVSEYY